MNNCFRKSVLLLAAFTVGVAGCKSSDPVSAKGARSAKPAAVLTADEQKVNADSYEYVWKTVRDKYWDAKIKGIDWTAAGEKYRAQAATATTQDEARAAMNALLHELGESHFGVFGVAEAGTEKDDAGHKGTTQATDGGAGELGLVVRLSGHQAIVAELAEGGAAEAAGIKRGWVLVAVGKARVAKAIDSLSALEERTRGVTFAQVMGHRLDVKAGRTVVLGFLDENDKARVVSVTASPAKSVPVKFGNIPEVQVARESRLLPGGVGYTRLSIFFDPAGTATWFNKSLNEMNADGQMKGLILDLRGNPGGIGAMAMSFGGFLVHQKGVQLGTMYQRSLNPGETTALKFIILPRTKTYDGPVAVLVDEFSVSTSEILAGGLQDIGRARVFGRPTPGMALPSYIENLPNGDKFQFVVANYISAGGKPLEGRGVQPDELIPLDRKLLAASPTDPVIAAASRWILSGGAATTVSNPLPTPATGSVIAVPVLR